MNAFVMQRISRLWPLVLLMAMAKLKPIDARPQDNAFALVIASGLNIMGDGISALGNGGMAKSDKSMEMPFGLGRVHSKKEVGIGEAAVNRQSSDEDRRRRKRSLPKLDVAVKTEWLPLQIHSRLKRSPCFSHGTMGGGTMGGGTPTGGGDQDIDVERRRKAAQRKRQAMAKRKKANASRKKTTTTTKSKKTNRRQFSSDDNGQQQALSRRKRQSEIDDLNSSNMQKDLSELTRQISEKIRNAWESFANAMNSMANNFKQKFAGGSGAAGNTDAEEI